MTTLSKRLVQQAEASNCSKNKYLGNDKLCYLIKFSECWNKHYMGEEGKKPREIGGKICNALFKPERTYPGVLALRFWKVVVEGRVGGTSH